MSNNIILQCPHCQDSGEPEWKTTIIVDSKELNCRIFRHGIMREVYQNSGKIVQIPPHASKAECDYLVNHKLIIGCGKPFRVVDEVVQDGAGAKIIQKAIMCEYI